MLRIELEDWQCLSNFVLRRPPPFCNNFASLRRKNQITNLRLLIVLLFFFEFYLLLWALGFWFFWATKPFLFFLFLKKPVL